MSENTQAYASTGPSFWKELCQLLNKHGIDSKLSTPDWIIANHLNRTIEALEKFVDSSNENTSDPEPAIAKND